MPNDDGRAARSSISAIGSGATMIGLLLLLAGSDRPLLLRAGQVLIGLGIVLLFVMLWQQHKRR
jgi:hypothetical protein